MLIRSNWCLADAAQTDKFLVKLLGDPGKSFSKPLVVSSAFHNYVQSRRVIRARPLQFWVGPAWFKRYGTVRWEIIGAWTFVASMLPRYGSRNALYTDWSSLIRKRILKSKIVDQWLIPRAYFIPILTGVKGWGEFDFPTTVTKCCSAIHREIT